MMAEFEHDVRRILIAHGCRFVRRGKGDHDIWESPINGHRFVVDGKIKSRHTANAIMKQAGIAHHF
jgi:predicted RNA binding protein YcfA (HicA-like mRNA interferase family)